MNAGRNNLPGIPRNVPDRVLRALVICVPRWKQERCGRGTAGNVPVHG